MGPLPGPWFARTTLVWLLWAAAQITRDTERHWLTAQEAVACGLVSRVIESVRELDRRA